MQHAPTREALQYLLNHATELQRYCDDGRLPMTNIRAEHVAKTIAVVRKNFLFAVSATGAKASTVIYSLIETAKLNGHHPFEYLTVVLNESAKAHRAECANYLKPTRRPVTIVTKFKLKTESGELLLAIAQTSDIFY